MKTFLMRTNGFKISREESNLMFLILSFWVIEGVNAREILLKDFLRSRNFRKLRAEIRCLCYLLLGRDGRKVRASQGRNLSKGRWREVAEAFRVLGPIAECRLNECLMIRLIRQGLQPHTFKAPPRRFSYEHLGC